MKGIIRFSKFFLPATILSVVLAVSGIAGYIILGGFNLGVDFQAGLIQEVQFAPAAFSLTWSGRGNATLSFDRVGLYIVISGAGVEGRTYSFPLSEYGTIGSLTQAFNSQVEGLNARISVPGGLSSQWLVHSAQGNPQLSSGPYVVHYLNPQSEAIPIREVREALAGLAETASVQNLGQPSDRHFMIRIEDKEIEGGEGIPAEKIIDALEEYFGNGEVVVLRSDYVGSRFSKNLTDQAGILLGLTLLIILVYASVRFKPQYAIGAVIAIVHDALIIVAFVTLTRMEFNTTTIAAILTILGYSINDTIVIFDRIRETRRIYPEDIFVNVLDRSLTETLGRTIITTLTTMLAVMSLYIFTSGSMKDFALALLVGMVSGVYSTIFIASGFVNLWESNKIKKEKKKLSGSTVPAKA
ncbi:MAG: protein translocase subunit SecF [Treponema sp.]|jgi:preprotein translocase subunit SecF|nr:protein translocase subunit SecF [Treponema sp.]